MNNEQFDKLVDELQRQSKDRPLVYQAKVALLAALGYGYILSIVVLLCALLIAVVLLTLKVHMSYLGLKVLVPIAALMWLLGKSLCIKFPAPEGFSIEENEAPQLFQTIAEIRRQTQGPQIDVVLINNEFNCCIAQQPRLGIFGWHKNYLVLGFPFMQSMSPAEFKAVLAHEMGHLCSDHGKFGSWIYGVRNAWSRIYFEIKTESWIGKLLLLRFCTWYTGIFDAYTFVLMRAHELEADQLSVRVAGTEVAARALINTAVRGAFLAETFWPGIIEGARDLPQPPANVYSQLASSLRNRITVEDATNWLNQQLKIVGKSHDTHPALSERLDAMGFTTHRSYDEQHVGQIVAMHGDAASELLTACLPQVQAQVQSAWQKDIETAWVERHEYFNTGKSELARLNHLSVSGQVLNKADQLALARWTSELQEKSAALELYQKLLLDEPTDADINNEYGHLLLERNDDSGIDYLNTAMTANPMLGLSNCQHIFAYLKKKQRDDEAQPYYARAVIFFELMEQAMLERNGISNDDNFEEHGLPQDSIARICEELEKHDQVSDAHLVRKTVEHLPTEPYLIVTVKIISHWYRLESANKERQTLDRLAASVWLPSAGIIISSTVAPQKLKSANKTLNGAHIFSRKK